MRSDHAAYKVALTSLPAQIALDSHTPLFGRLLRSDIRESGSHINLASLFSPLVEPELVFRIDEDLCPHASLDDVTRRSCVAAGLECPDGRFREWLGDEFPLISINDFVADNCLAGFGVVSGRWIRADQFDLASIDVDLFHDLELFRKGTGAAVLGNPANAVVWLNEQLSNSGGPLRAGTLVWSGACTSPVRAIRGSFRGFFGDELGSVTTVFL
jgi:2-keto-4-pentenoate hydratase